MKLINFIFAIAIGAALLIPGCGCGAGISVGEGKKIGQIVKIGKHGLFCSTYEAEIIRGGFNGGSGINGSALNFSIKNKNLAESLMLAMEQQEEIELHYSKRSFSGPCYSETDTIAVGFKILNKKTMSESSETKISSKVEEINMNDELIN